MLGLLSLVLVAAVMHAYWSYFVHPDVLGDAAASADSGALHPPLLRGAVRGAEPVYTTLCKAAMVSVTICSRSVMRIACKVVKRL